MIFLRPRTFWDSTVLNSRTSNRLFWKGGWEFGKRKGTGNKLQSSSATGPLSPRSWFRWSLGSKRGQGPGCKKLFSLFMP